MSVGYGKPIYGRGWYVWYWREKHLWRWVVPMTDAHGWERTQRYAIRKAKRSRDELVDGKMSTRKL